VGELYNSEGLTHAASIAYYALLSLFPFLLLILSILGTFTTDASDRDAVVRFVFRYFPRQFDFMTGQLDAFRDETLQLGIGGLLALIWASLGVFNAISSAVNHAWGVERRRSFLMHRFISFLMMLSAGAIFVIALVLASIARVGPANWFWGLVERSPWLVWLTQVSADYGATVLLIGCVALLFYFIPNTEIRFRWVWPGAILTGMLWRGALSAFSWYARDLAAWNVIHGSIAAVVIFLLWIYVSAVILLYGVEMTAAYARLRAAAVKHPSLAGQPERQPAPLASA
jgi:membrane protein